MPIRVPVQAPGSALFSKAMRKHLDGDLASAEALYREIILADPGDPHARHYLGFLLQQTDRLDEAHLQLSRAIELDDNHADWYFNLGIVTSRQGRVTASIDAFSSAIAIDPDKYFYWANLGASFELSLQWIRAEQCYLAAARLDPDCPDAYYLLSALYLKLERFSEARHFNYRGIIAAPAGSTSIIARGQACQELGRKADAITLFENWQTTEPDNPVAAHLLAACRGRLPPDQCSARYIEQTFDAFANSFENILGRLKYCGPALVQDHLATLDLPAASLDVLDLGCGTGLIGEILEPYSRVLTGVDLSRSMLGQAAAKQRYHHLHQTGIDDFLRSSPDRFDLVSCMDTFIYIGRLEKVCELIYQRLKIGGLLLFSTEKLAAPHEHGFRLNVSGRYSHTQEYLTRLLNDAGFHIAKICDVTIRTEAGCPIEGQFVCAMRER